LETASILAHASPNNTILMGVRNPTKGAQCLRDLQSRNPPGTLILLDLDLTLDASIASAASCIEKDYGRLDVLINNAGIEINEPKQTRETMHKVFDTNIFGPMLLTNALMPLLAKSKTPKIINVSSVLGSISYMNDPSSGPYGVAFHTYRASKAAMNMMSAIQWRQLKAMGGMLWTFCPGFVVSNLSGPEDVQWRKDSGGEMPDTSARGVVEILEGKRDAEVGGFVGKYGKVYTW
jgi:NAD(P)-dependent dehydrogenase (short-subunit alcohol dehydrogenase family)